VAGLKLCLKLANIRSSFVLLLQLTNVSLCVPIAFLLVGSQLVSCVCFFLFALEVFFGYTSEVFAESFCLKDFCRSASYFEPCK